jgi:ArsR family metal-binding transcriptional regulator
MRVQIKLITDNFQTGNLFLKKIKNTDEKDDILGKISNKSKKFEKF